MKKNNSGFFLTLIVIVAMAAAVFVYPKYWGAEFQPWRLGLDLVGGSHLIYNMDLSQVAAADQDSVINGLRDVIERRVNLFGVAEPQVYTAKSGNQAQLIVDLAGVKNLTDAINQIGATPLLYFGEIRSPAPGVAAVPPDIAMACGVSPSSTLSITNLTGRYVTGAQLTFNQTTNAPQVAISFNGDGSQIFQNITAANVGKPLPVFIDDQLMTCPVVQEAISGGQALITGNFSLKEAQALVQRFNAGALPAPITLVNQQTVSPTLGTDSLNRIIVAGLIGTLLVIIFMIIYYRSLGVFAALALLIYIALTLGIFKLIPITLSLAGLAGFILTIGMAVDANILIFERVKEELKRGLSRTSAIHEGFKRAWPSIRDSNTSTIITAVILYYWTSSFVRGFALTLLIGVIVSLFSAITTTRLFLEIFVKDEPKRPPAQPQPTTVKPQT